MDVIKKSTEEQLDNYEYPELGERRVRSKNPSCSVIALNEDDMTKELLAGSKVKTKHAKSNYFNKYRRTKRLYLNLQKILENGRYFNKINISPNNSICSTQIDIKQIKISITKFKRPSKLKRSILLERKFKAQRNTIIRELCNDENNGSSVTDIDSMDFSMLKITTDFDFTNRMSTIACHSTNYLRLQDKNFSKDSILFRPDVIDKFNNLVITQTPDNGTSVSCQQNSTVEFEDTIDTIVFQQLSLESNDNVDTKKDVNDTSTSTNKVIKYSNKFREYCTNLLTSLLNESLEKFLSEMKRLQTKLYNRDQRKGRYKRRYYSGFKEVQKHVELKKLKFVIIAPDIEKIEIEGGLDERVSKLLEACRRHEVAFCFGLRRRKLGYYTHGNGFVSCIGVANYEGIEETFKNVLMEVVRARNEFKRLRDELEETVDPTMLVNENDLLSESVKKLLKILTCIY